MLKHLLHTSLFLTSLLALIACSEEGQFVQEIAQPTPIELTVGVAEEGSYTRATVITDGTDKSKRAFTNDTKLRLVIQSDNLDEGHDTEHKHTVTIATAAKVADDDKNADGTPKDDSKSSVTINPARYWDDAYARKGAVSIYALAVADNNNADSKFADTKWGTVTPQTTGGGTETAWISGVVNKDKTGTAPNEVLGTTLTWTIGTSDKKQTATTIADDDLCFSNYIVDYRNDGSDNRLKYNNITTSKFDKGNLIFYHALSKITFQVFAGEGFTDGSKVAETFAFTSGNIKMKGFSNSGTFDVMDGKFTSVADPIEFSEIACSTPQRDDNTQSVYTLTAYVMPGTNMTTEVSDALSFVIYNNEYKISMSKLLDAIKGKTENMDGEQVKTSVLDNHTNLKAGVHYHFTFTVKKSEVKGIEAQIVNWENVDAVNIVPSNAKVKLNLEQRGLALDRDLNLYRLGETASTITTNITNEYGKGYNWSATAYEGPNLYDYDNTSNKMTNTWYWPNNKTFYHFRAVSPTSLAKATADSKDYIPLTAGETYSDVLWGAPFKELDSPNPSANTEKLTYSITNGFDGTDSDNHQIYPAIGATEDIIHLLLFHMMSDVTINVKTEGTAEEKVLLGNGTAENCTTIQFKDISTTGKADMGNGCVTADATTDYSFTSHPAPSSTDGPIKWSNYGAIPQALSTGTKDVVLIITTPDHNQYEVTMKDIWANVVSTNNLSNPYTETKTVDGNTLYKIDRWYPGYKYTYTITLKKKGISDIQATILDWETVEATADGVQIK